jgi:hypothetical protein
VSADAPTTAMLSGKSSGRRSGIKELFDKETL